MKKRKIELRDLFFLAIMIIPFVLILVYAQRSKTDIKDNIKNNIAYSLAEVTAYAPRDRCLGLKFDLVDPIININFDYNGKQIYTNSKELLIDRKDCVGKKFVVVYDSTNPENCILLLNCPVNTKDDFDEYFNYFKNNPPKL